MSEPISNPNPAPSLAHAPETTPEKTFTQAEVDSIVGKRLAKALKGVPAEEELAKFRAWEKSQQTEQERWNALTQERDTARTDLTAAQEELEQARRENLLLKKGVPVEDVDYHAFKIGKLVTEEVDFAAAAERYFKDYAPKGTEAPAGTMRVDFAAPLGGSKTPMTREEIFKIKDPTQRQNAIAQNIKLFRKEF